MLAKRILSALDALSTQRGALMAALGILGVGLVLAASGPDANDPTKTATSAPAAPAATTAEAKPQVSSIAVAPTVDASKAKVIAAATAQAQARSPQIATATMGTILKVADAPGPFTQEQTEAIGAIVKSYLLAHPEVMVEVSKQLESKQQAEAAETAQKVVVDKKASIFRSATDGVTGNPSGDITLVEFFDYNCSWCKKSIDELAKLTASDPKLRIVLKEFPIFGEDSVFAAKAAMASLAQGKYWAFHQALMREKKVTKENTIEIAQKVGLDVARLKTDMADPKWDAMIKETQETAQALGIEGTPGFLVDAKLNVGYLPAEGLTALINETRKAGCKIC